ncbi:hypothetical protein JOY44_17000 [Phormidium sp. CLA17]|uniref:hypothetical protein n=1 Tax=Leptolyngbya sp. Cla-17 TaxID=2803751 RepID=UPI001491DEB5|nr:hypothetical protein [Leptolyngbya sp. Cla-17]MBM0743290.1 hypothetical protein [Leptolyngbya sp. Cla-17]
MAKQAPAVLKEVSVSLPFGIGSAKWQADPTEQNAAWSLYVELVTRIAVQSLGTEQGLLREALNSLYTLFGTTREVLRSAGPKVGASRHSVGGIAIAVLNNGLRPFMARWHPTLEEWEVQRASNVSKKVHEQNWSEVAQMRQELTELRSDLEQYAIALAKIAGVEQ